jgi:hypothetical protein
VVVFGPSGEDSAKAAALRAILVWAGRNDMALATIDLTVPGAPTATTTDGAAIAP